METFHGYDDVEIIAFINSKEYANQIHNLFGGLSYKLFVPFLFDEFRIAEVRNIFSGEDFQIIRFKNILDFDFNLAKRNYIFYIPKPYAFFNNNLKRYIKAIEYLNCILTGFEFRFYSKLRKKLIDEAYLPLISKDDSLGDLAEYLEKFFPFYYLNIDKFNIKPNFLFGRKEDLLKKQQNIKIAFDTLTNKLCR